MRKDYEFGIAGVLWVKSVCNRMNKFMEEHRENGYDIMNPNGFILEVPAELRMRRKQRKKIL